MAGRTAHLAEIVEAPTPVGSATLASRDHVWSECVETVDAAPASMFGEVPRALEMKMELVARASASPERALPVMIDLLVDGGAEKRAAIVEAIATNDSLREQWERTWTVLRR